jgi:hypothetical protein
MTAQQYFHLKSQTDRFQSQTFLQLSYPTYYKFYQNGNLEFMTKWRMEDIFQLKPLPVLTIGKCREKKNFY